MTPPRAYPTAVTRTSDDFKRVLPTSELLWKLGDQLLKFGLRPRAGGAGTHVSLRAEGECELRNIIAVGSIQNDEDVIGARGDVDLLDLEAQFPRQLLGGVRPLGSVLHRTDALVGPVERQYERRHVLLPCSKVSPRRLMGSTHHLAKASKTLRCRALWTHDQPTP